MKKLMVAAAIVCAAACVQAASCTWNAGAFMDAAPALVAQGTTVYFLQNIGDTTQDKILSAFNTSGSISGYLNSANTLSTGMVGGSFTDGAPVGAFSAYVALISSDADGKRIFISTAANSVWDSGTAQANEWSMVATDTMASLSNKFSADGGFKGVGWYTQSAVPEPTSGLLLLLGVAGLALRRRRA